MVLAAAAAAVLHYYSSGIIICLIFSLTSLNPATTSTNNLSRYRSGLFSMSQSSCCPHNFYSSSSSSSQPGRIFRAGKHTFQLSSSMEDVGKVNKLKILFLTNQGAIHRYKSVVLSNGTMPAEEIAKLNNKNWLGTLLNLAAVRLAVDYVNSQRELLPRFHLVLQYAEQTPLDILRSDENDAIVISDSSLTKLSPFLNQLNATFITPLTKVGFSDQWQFCREKANETNMLENDNLLIATQLTFVADIGKWKRLGVVTSATNFHDLNAAKMLVETAARRSIETTLMIADPFEFPVPDEDEELLLEDNGDNKNYSLKSSSLEQIRILDMRVIIFQLSNSALSYQLLVRLYHLGITGPRYVFIFPTLPHLLAVKSSLLVPKTLLAEQLRFSFFIGTLPALQAAETPDEMQLYVNRHIGKAIEPTDTWPVYRDLLIDLALILNETQTHHSLIIKQVEDALQKKPLPIYVSRLDPFERLMRTTPKPQAAGYPAARTSDSDVASFVPFKFMCNNKDFFLEYLVPMRSIWANSPQQQPPKHGSYAVELADEVDSHIYGIVVSCAAFLAVVDSLIWLNPWLLRLQGRKHKTMLLGGSILAPGCLLLDAAAVCFVTTPIATGANLSSILCACDVIFTALGLSLLHGISTFRLALSGRKTHNAWLLLSHSSQVLFCCRFTRIHSQQQRQQANAVPEETVSSSANAMVQMQPLPSSSGAGVLSAATPRSKRQFSYSYLSGQAKLQLAVIGTIWFTLLNAILVTFWFSTDLIHLDAERLRNGQRTSYYNVDEDVVYKVKLTTCTSSALGWWLMAVGIGHAFLVGIGCCYAVALWYQNQIHPIAEYGRLSAATFSQLAMLFTFLISLMATNRPPSVQHAILAFVCLGSSSTGVLFLHLRKTNPVNNAIQQIMLRQMSRSSGGVGGSGNGSAGGSQTSGMSCGQQDIAFSLVRRLQAVEILTPITEEARSQSTPKKQQSRNGSQNDNNSNKTAPEYNSAITNVIRSTTPTINGAGGQFHGEHISSNSSNNTVFYEHER